MNTETVRFPDGNQAQAVQVNQGASPARIAAALALPRPRAVLVLNGGTQELTGELAVSLGSVLRDGLARVVAEEGITAITGGTDAGIFHFFGQGLAHWGRSAPCIGVAVGSLAKWPGKTAGEAPLEPNHSHDVLVEGDCWGDETETMYALAATLGNNCPSVAIFASGGEIALHEMLANVVQERQMILLAGSGRVTDAVLAARDGQLPDDPRIAQIAQLGKIIPHEVYSPPSSLSELIRQVVILEARTKND